MIEVFIHSRSAYMDVALAREMSQHGFCDLYTATRASEIFSSKLKGRMLSDEDWAVLQKLAEVANSTDDEIEVYDVSRATDKFKALSRGIRKTPTIVINGAKHEGVEKSLAILGKHCSKKL